MTIPEDNWDCDQWELDQCRYCKGPIEEPTEAYCSRSCELKWLQQNEEHADNSPSSSSVFSVHATTTSQSHQSTPRSTPASSATSTPEFGPIILPSGSVPNLPLDTFQLLSDRRHSYAMRSSKFGSSHNPVKKSFPSNYYQSTVGDRSGVRPIFMDKSVSLGIRKTSADDIRTSPLLATAMPEQFDKQSSYAVEKKSSEPAQPRLNRRGSWAWRRLSTFI